MKKRLIALSLTGVILLSGCSPKWEDKFDISYIGSDYTFTTFDGKYTETPYSVSIYEITNTTDKAIHGVTVVVDIKLVAGGGFSFKEIIGTIQPNETKKYNLHQDKIQDEAEKNGVTKLLYTSEIARIEWD